MGVPQFGQNLPSVPSGSAHFPQAVGRSAKPHWVQKRPAALLLAPQRMQATCRSLERATGGGDGSDHPEFRLRCESYLGSPRRRCPPW